MKFFSALSTIYDDYYSTFHIFSTNVDSGVLTSHIVNDKAIVSSVTCVKRQSSAVAVDNFPR